MTQQCAAMHLFCSFIELNSFLLAVHSIGPIALENCDAPSEDASSNVFGWFRFCRRPLLRLTVREKVMES